jgi:hypothetical protein
MLKYNSLKDFLEEQKRQELLKKRLAEKLYYTVKKGTAEEIVSVFRQCSEGNVDFKDLKYDYLLEYFDTFRTGYNKPSVIIIRLIISYQKIISIKAIQSFYNNIYYRNILDEEELAEITPLIIKE